MKAFGVMLLHLLLWGIAFCAVILLVSIGSTSAETGQRTVSAPGEFVAWVMLLTIGALGVRGGARRIRRPDAWRYVSLAVIAALLGPMIALLVLIPVLVVLQISMDLSLGPLNPDNPVAVLAGLVAVSVTLAVVVALRARRRASARVSGFLE